MKLKSITFRCSQAQLNRMENAILTSSAESRTAFISEALETFLTFAEQDEIQRLNLFELVDRVDAKGTSTPFAQQA